VLIIPELLTPWVEQGDEEITFLEVWIGGLDKVLSTNIEGIEDGDLYQDIIDDTEFCSDDSFIPRSGLCDTFELILSTGGLFLAFEIVNFICILIWMIVLDVQL
jgi:hypothetical protein